MMQEQIPAAALLHAHSYYSFLERELLDQGKIVKSRIAATSSPAELVKKAIEKGFTSLAITDPNFYGLGEFFKVSNDKIKPIAAVELSLDTGWGKPLEATFIAKNQKGLHTIFEYSTRVSRDHHFVSINKVLENRDDVILLIRDSDPRAESLLSAKNVYFAIDNPATDTITNAITVGKKHKGKTVVAHEIRMAHPGEYAIFNFLAGIKNSDGKQLLGKTDNYVLKTPTELSELYRPVYDALGRSNELVQEMNVHLPPPSSVKARLAEKEHKDSFEFLTELIKEKIKRYSDYEILQSRIDYEMTVIKRSNFADYILICYEISQFCKANDIPFAVVGSGNNSAVLMVLGITETDARGLMPEIFLHPSREDDPDIDFSFPDEYKQKIMNLLFDTYPEVAIQLGVVNRIRKQGTIRLSKTALQQDEIEKIARADIPLYVSTHPSGIIFPSYLPQQVIAGKIIAQADKDSAEKIYRAKKIDILARSGPSYLSQIKKELELSGMELRIPPEDTATMERLFFKEGAIGIPNVESPHLRNILRTVGEYLRQQGDIPTIDHLAQILAIARPGKFIRDRYYEFMKTGDSLLSRAAENFPDITSILARTNYTVIYEDQVKQLAIRLAGMTNAEADTFKKIVSGLDSEEKNRLTDSFINGLRKKKLPEEVIDELINQISATVSFIFKEGHAQALAEITYEVAYLAERYPAHFWAGMLTSVSGNPGAHMYPLQMYINEAIRNGISFEFPQINKIVTEIHVKNAEKLILTAGKILFPKNKKFPDIYNRFWDRLNLKNLTIPQLVRSQLKDFGTSYTHNPIHLFKPEYHYHPKKTLRRIIGQPLARRPDMGRLGRIDFVTIDSGTVIDAVMFHDLWESNRELFERKFWNVDVTYDEEFDRWNITGVHPLTRNELAG